MWGAVRIYILYEYLIYIWTSEIWETAYCVMVSKTCIMTQIGNTCFEKYNMILKNFMNQ